MEKEYNLNAVVVEDNGGGVHLYVFSGEKEVYIHCGYEYQQENALIDDLQALIDQDSVEGWEGNELEAYECNLIPHFDDLEFENNVNNVIAIVKDRELTLYSEKMGIEGRRQFISLLEEKE